MDLLERIEHYDQQLLIVLNNLNSPFWDDTMLLLTDKWIWIPMYILFLFFIFKKLGKRNGLIALLGAFFLIYFCDRGSVVLFKEVFQRFRPCHNSELYQYLHIVKEYCGGQFGFVSSHATNSFGLVGYILGILSPRNHWKILLIFWASLVAYTRVYLGVHYPLDILGGALLGMALGIALGKTLKYYFFTSKGKYLNVA